MVFCDDGASEGYTLFSPIPSNTTYLIDHEGRLVHTWTSPGEHRPAISAYLLPDGDLLRTANIAASAVGNFSGGGTGGKLERISWDGELEWSWEYSSETFISHHDVEPPTFMARSMTLQIFSDWVSERLRPKTVKSWLYT